MVKPNKQWCEAQQTMLLLPPSEWYWLVNASPHSSEIWPVITNKLTFDPLTRLPELTQNFNRSSHGHYTPSLKISRKSVQPFALNVADKERKKERNRPKTIPCPPTRSGVIKHKVQPLIRALSYVKWKKNGITSSHAMTILRCDKRQQARSLHHWGPQCSFGRKNLIIVYA